MENHFKNSYKLNDHLRQSMSIYNVGNQKCQPNHTWGPGIRDHYCFHYIISGTGKFIANNKIYYLEQGDAFMLYPNSQVEYEADEVNPWHYAWVGFMGHEVSSILHQTDFSKTHPVMKNILPNALMEEQLQAIYKVKGSSYKDELAMTGSLYALLSSIIHYSAKKEIPKEDIQLTYVENAIDFISTRFSYPMTVDDIANYTGISRSHLYRSFQKHTGQSPKEFLVQFRITQACQLLKNTNITIRTIAHSVGFENSLYFSKAFKQQTGLSPTQYREKL